MTDNPNVLQLGVEFDESAIDLVNDTITVEGHNFEDGDQVFYKVTTGATGATGLVDNGVKLYTVNVIDDDTIKLVDPALVTVPVSFNPSELIDKDNDNMTPDTPLVEANEFFIPAHGFVDNQAVTYTAPQKIEVVPTQVDVQIVGNVVLRDANDEVDTSVDTNAIFIGDHTFVDGDLIVYEVDGGSPITGLVSGTTYEVIFDTSVSIKLSQVRADPMVDPLVAIDVSGVSDGTHSIRRVGQLPIGGLNDGQTYYVQVATAKSTASHCQKPLTAPTSRSPRPWGRRPSPACINWVRSVSTSPPPARAISG